MPNSSWPHGLSHARFLCPPLSVEYAQIHVHWVGDTILNISSSATPFSFFLQSFPTSGSFPMSQLFPSGGQNIRASASTIVLSMDIQGWFPISLQSKVLSRLLLQHHNLKVSGLWCSTFFTVQVSHPYMTTGKAIVLTRRTFVDKIMCLLFNMLSRLVITFLSSLK